jgi:hypothetical protein
MFGTCDTKRGVQGLRASVIAVLLIVLLVLLLASAS